MSRYGYFEEPEELKVTISATFDRRQFGELELIGKKGLPIVFYMLPRYSILNCQKAVLDFLHASRLPAITGKLYKPK